MTVYVDEARWTRRGVKNPRQTYAHMVADSLEELHAFAERLGVRRHFFEPGERPHYDINGEQRALAVALGAVRVSPRDILKTAKTLKED